MSTEEDHGLATGVQTFSGQCPMASREYFAIIRIGINRSPTPFKLEILSLELGESGNAPEINLQAEYSQD